MNVDLSYIESAQIGSAEWVKSASDYFFEVAEGCHTEYGCPTKGSSSNFEKAEKYLTSQGYVCFVQDLSAPDETIHYQLVQRDLEKGLVTLCSGYNNVQSKVGHAWIIDGIRYISTEHPEIWHQFHLLWGYLRCTSWSVFYDRETYEDEFGTTELDYKFRKKILYIGDYKGI